MARSLPEPVTALVRIDDAEELEVTRLPRKRGFGGGKSIIVPLFWNIVRCDEVARPLGFGFSAVRRLTVTASIQKYIDESCS